MPKYVVTVYVEFEAKDKDQAIEFANNIVDGVEIDNDGDDRSVWMGEIDSAS